MIRNDGPSRFYGAGAILNCHSPAVTARHYLEFARLERKEPDRERKIRSGLRYLPSARYWIRTCGHLYKHSQELMRASTLTGTTWSHFPTALVVWDRAPPPGDPRSGHGCGGVYFISRQ